jgi:hypothetical protein
VQRCGEAANSWAWNLVDVKDDEVAVAKRSHGGDHSGALRLPFWDPWRPATSQLQHQH